MRAEIALATALALAACDGERPCPGGDLAPLERSPRFAVVASDYSATAIAMLDAEGGTLAESWIDSGTTAPGLSATLSGDVVLASGAPAGELMLIDRLGVDVITRIAVPSGEVIAQHRVADGFRANPQDALAVGGSLYVSRHEPNLDPGAPTDERGSDLVVVDLASGARTARIDLSALDAGTGDTRVYARPGRLVALHGGRFVLIGIARLALDFVPGPGATAVLEVATGTLTSLALPTFENCGEVAAIPADDTSALVLCLGRGFDPDRGIWYDPELRRPGAGIVRVAVDASGMPRVDAVWAARDHAGVQPPSTGLVPLSATRALVVASGTSTLADELLLVDLAGGVATVVTRSDDPFTLLGGAFDAETGQVLVPDTVWGLLRFDGRAPAAPAVIGFDPCHGLPPTEVRLISRPL